MACSCFCSAGCRTRFVERPDQYLGTPAGHPAPPDPQIDPGQVVEYTCPMHPEVRQPGPGACPICGMALEPVTVTADTGPSAELVDMTRRFWIGLVLAAPVLLLEMGGDLLSGFGSVLPPGRYVVVRATTR